jgi:hypothetical protein
VYGSFVDSVFMCVHATMNAKLGLQFTQSLYEVKIIFDVVQDQENKLQEIHSNS